MIAALAILFGLIAAWYVLQLLLYQYRNKRKRCSQPTVVQGMSSATPFAG